MSISSDRPDTPPGHRPAVATACGKLILLGEHSVVYGEPALAVPLPQLRLSVVLSTSPGGLASIVGAGLDQKPGRVEEFAMDDLRETSVFPVFGPGEPEGEPPLLSESRTMALDGPPPLRIDVGEDAPTSAESEIARALAAAARELSLPVPLPLRLAVRGGGLCSGMGTSAALGAALARGLLLFHGRQPGTEEVLRAAGAVEALFHTDPSGVDHTVSVNERPVWFIKGKAPRLLGKLPELEFAVLPRQSEEPTSTVVRGVRDRLAGDPGLVRVIADLGRWTRDGRIAWAAGNLQGLAEAMRAAQASLERIGVVNELDREGIAAAMDAGALAAKITGAGQGGTLLALVDSSCADAVLENWGPRAFLLRVGGD
ncbi:MAG: hypothetical protein VX498_03845 [Myxococcota bacterium]|nr:hypothetical protein [Myxococcota bacterium]